MKKFVTTFAIAIMMLFVAFVCIKAEQAYAAASIKLTYNANGGTASKTSMTVIKGQKVGVMPTPKRSGYTWLGWYTSKISGTRITMSTPANFKGNITLYAHWEKTQAPVLKKLESAKTYSYDISGDSKTEKLKVESAKIGQQNGGGIFFKVFIDGKRVLAKSGSEFSAYYYTTGSQNEYLLINQTNADSTDIQIYTYSSGKLVLCRTLSYLGRLKLEKLKERDLLLSGKYDELYGASSCIRVAISNKKATAVAWSLSLKDYVFVANEAFDLLASANSEASISTSVEEGTAIKIISIKLVNETAYYYVLADGNKGWVTCDFLAKNSSSFTPEYYERITGAGLAVRDGEHISLDPSWEFASFSEINTGYAVYYKASANRKNILVGVNAGHGTEGGDLVETYCHPDKTAKLTDGTTAKGAIKAVAVSTGMFFNDGTEEKVVTLEEARILRDLLLGEGYDVLMLRDDDDVQLDNVARTVICNKIADCHISVHWDNDGLKYDKGCFYMSVPNGLKKMYPVSKTWQKSNKLSNYLVSGLKSKGNRIFDSGSLDQDLTQTSYSKVPSVNIELGNQASAYDEATLSKLANGLLAGINKYFAK